MRSLEAPSDHPKEVSAIAAFLIADIDITDPTTYEDYKRQVAPLIARFGGRYLARGARTRCWREIGSRTALWCWSSPTWPPSKLGMPLLSLALHVRAVGRRRARGG